MIPLIERGESSPSAVVLEKLAAGLGVMLASLFDAPAEGAQAPSGPVTRRDDQPQWQDPASGYLRRNVSPPGVPRSMPSPAATPHAVRLVLGATLRLPTLRFTSRNTRANVWTSPQRPRVTRGAAGTVVPASDVRRSTNTLPDGV